MTRDELLALGLTEEQAEPILAAIASAEQAAAENAALQAQVEALTAQVASLTEELALRDKHDAVLAALPAFHPKDPRILLRLIDLAKIETGEGGEIHGLAEQVQALRARAPYLFTDAPDPTGGSAASGLPASLSDMNTFLRGE